MKTNPNDTAYPSADISNYEETNAVGGLTKREYFAAMAMQGIEAGNNPLNDDIDVLTIDEVVRRAVRIADALIKELNKKVQG